ncbi:probable C-terminal domain small phosphatase [Vigna radiata var. radiata]|uniref:Mitochondrial import inner membrane translocase subunit TIM50 n=1 Tax=Vigna radiata var. radiata TaxID=3916 RepID=A0A3Q0ETA8_VIGRR|nr:probable C-terminal domain small phosphatase [Vigna radiata var. radiata]
MAGKKLLVMNLNGLLMHRVPYRNLQYIRAPNGVYGRSGKFAVFKRPFCEEFMKFCLERFEVGIWSSSKGRNIDGALAIAMGSIRENISFKLDRSHCTDSGYPSLERRNKPLFFKEFNKMWKNVKKSGSFNVSNTLMIDDKPYKAFLNPVSRRNSYFY